MTLKTKDPTTAPTDSRFSEVLEQIASEFVEYAGETVQKLGDFLVQVDGGIVSPKSVYDEFFREVHTLKGLAGSFGYALLGSISHRLEDYISDLDGIEKSHIHNIGIFVGRMEDALEGEPAARNADAAEIVRALPIKGGFEVRDVTKANVEIMLVMPRDAASHFIDRELRACGYRVTIVPEPLRALEMLLVARPDLICASGILDGLSSVDFACALRAMPISRDIPVALITTLSRTDSNLAGLPGDVPMIRKGAEFSDDIADALSSLGIT